MYHILELHNHNKAAIYLSADFENGC